MKIFSLLFMFTFSLSSFGQSKVAVVKILRGEVDLLTIGKTTKLKADDWVTNGSIIKTSDKSFVKLVFIDKSQMNVGPNSEMKIESFSEKDSGVIDLVKGKIRSQVTKDYLQMEETDKSKLFIKTKNAVMGVRGTDFLISTNGINTSTVLFEGEVVFNKLDSRGDLSSRKLEEIVDRGVRILPGEFSVVETNRPLPTVPALINIQQREKLEKNDSFESDRSPSNAQPESSKSIVPEGLTGKLVSNSPDILKTEVSQISENVISANRTLPASTNPEGFVDGDKLKPANGSYLHVDSGIIIPPSSTSVLDTNTNTFIPNQDAGRVALDGSYIPPQNIEITNDGKIMVAVDDGKGGMIVQEVPPPTPVITSTSSTLDSSLLRTTASQTTSDTSLKTTTTQTSDSPLLNTTIDSRFAPTGGIMNVNDPQRTQSGFSPTTIRVKD